MTITENDFNVRLDPSPSKAVIGMNTSLNLFFSNTSNVDRGYNLTVQTILPDGVSFIDSSIEPTSIVMNPSGTITLTFINIKDLAPNELDYAIELTLKSDITFRSTSDLVPFDIPLTSIDITGTVDTLPRGDDEIGPPFNEKISKTVSQDFIPLRYDLIKSAPGKMPKGAGTISPATAPMWPFEYELTILNNANEPSAVSLIDILPNGVRFLDQLMVEGPDAQALSSPIITIPSLENGQDYVSIDWGNVSLSSNSKNHITFEVAIWDNFTLNGEENLGTRIPHQTPLENIATLDGLSGPVESRSITNAMDATIYKSVNPSITDVSNVNQYTLTYQINQYDDIDNFTIIDEIKDGQVYNDGSASISPDSIVIISNGSTELTWNLGLLTIGITGNITFTTTVSNEYIDNSPVAAFDSLDNLVNINGLNTTTSTQTPDSAKRTVWIQTPLIRKEILGYYYQDGTPKSIDVASPLDEVEFKITYDSLGLIATQLNIEIDEYAPSTMGPLEDTIPVAYTSTFGGSFSPVTVSPNGLRWILGNIPGDSLWTAAFKVPVTTSESIGSNNNLAKLAGLNSVDLGYSHRDQVLVNFGSPNIQFNKTVTGPDPQNVRAGEIYTYHITVSNPQNDEGLVTDAFEMDLTDVIPDGLIYNESFEVTGTGIFTPPVFNNQNVSMTIQKLGPDEFITLSFSVLVQDSLVSGEIFENAAVLQRPYSQSDGSYQYSGDPFIALAILKASDIQIQKSISPSFTKVGDIVEYEIKATVPFGTNAYNVRLIDTFQSSNQVFITGSASIDGNLVTPIVSDGEVIFPSIESVDATLGAIEIYYTFNVRVIDISFEAPFTQEQINTATITWEFESGETLGPVQTQTPLYVQIPHLTALKEQRNITQNTNFRTNRLNYNVSDRIEYRISITNDGDATAFDAIATDEIPSLLDFEEGSISTTLGSASFDGNSITWILPSLQVGETATMTFSVVTLSGVAAGADINNQVSFIYLSNTNGFEISFGPDFSNTVRLRAPFVRIQKTTSISEGRVGDTLTYTVRLTFPFGTISYNPRLEDTLPNEQIYVGPSTKQILPDASTEILPNSTNPLIFDLETIDATLEEQVIIYTFVARITNASHEPPFIETQTNTAFIRWALINGGSLSRNRNSQVNITVLTPYISLMKEQKKAQDSNYTKDPIVILPGDEIHYRITLLSDGAVEAYNTILTDALDNLITYNTILSGPAPTISSNTLTWNLENIPNGESIVIEFSVLVNTNIAPSSSIINQLNVSYDSSTENPITYLDTSNQTILQTQPPILNKETNILHAFLGDVVTYTLTLTIPTNSIAFNGQLEDLLPSGQIYIPDSLMKNGNPIDPFSTIPLIPEAPSDLEEGTIVYTFNARIEGLVVSPQDVQENVATFSWNVGESKTSIQSSTTIYATNSDIEIIKRQRNFTKDGNIPFTTDPITGKIDDLIHYEFSIKNLNPTYPIYNISMEDILDEYLEYIAPLEDIYEGQITVTDHTLNWSIPTIGAGETITIILVFKIVPYFEGNNTFSNTTSTVFSAVEDSPILYGPRSSNIVTATLAPYINIQKEVSQNPANVGQIIIYYLTLTVPLGTIAYNVEVEDMLPDKQLFIGDTLKNGTPITPTLEGQKIIFPQEAIIDATLEVQTILYSFKARIMRGHLISPFIDSQINQVVVNWETDDSGTVGDTFKDQVNVSVNSPYFPVKNCCEPS